MPKLIQKHLWKPLVGALLLVVGMASMLVSPAPAQAAINQQINLQSRVTDSSGNIVGDGDYNMEFKLMTVASGGDTTQGSCTTSCVWMETRTGANKVTVSRGLMSIQLGSVTSLSSVNFNQSLWLSIRIGGTGTPSWDAEMSPRDQLGAAPTAIFSANSDQLNGQTASYYLNAANLTGTLSDARLSSNVPLKNTANVFSQSQEISNAGGKTTLQLSNTGSNTGLTIGGDTTLYRSAADNLKTDDTFSSLALVLNGAQTKDITTASGTSPAALVLQPGDATIDAAGLTVQAGSNSVSEGQGGTLSLNGGAQTGGGGPSSSTGGTVNISGGNNTGASGTRNGGSVSIDGGTGASANGGISIGTTNAASLLLGRSGATTTLAGGNSSTLTFGDVNLYRGTTNQLKTDDAFNANSYLVAGTSGASTTCSGGQVLQNQVVSGGIVTGGSCVSSSSNAFVQDGNSFGSQATLGTNDSNALAFETGGNTQVSIAVGGATIFQNSTNSTNAFDIKRASAGGTLFNVDTTNSEIHASSGSYSDPNPGFAAALKVDDNIATNQLRLGSDAGTATSGITLGSTGDTNLYRTSAGNALKTDDSFEAAGNINASGTGSKVKEQGNDLVPSGSIMQSAGVSVPAGWLDCDGSAVSRTTYSNLFAALSISTTGNRTSGSAVISSIPSTTGMQAGMPISGTGIAGNTAILSVDSGTQITMTQNASSTGTGGAIVVAPYGVGDGSTTFNLPDFRSKSAVGSGTGEVKANFASSDITSTGTSNVIRMNGPQTEYQTATPVVFNVVSGSAPGGLSNSTTYYIIRLSATTIRLASSAANAIAGTGMNITSVGSGTYTFTYSLDAMTQGEQGGEQTHTQLTTELAAHNHGVTDPGHVHGMNSINGTHAAGGTARVTGSGTTVTTSSALTGISINNTGSNTAFNVRNPFEAVRFIIKY